jgi:hypothetical protein
MPPHKRGHSGGLPLTYVLYSATKLAPPLFHPSAERRHAVAGVQGGGSPIAKKKDRFKRKESTKYRNRYFFISVKKYSENSLSIPVGIKQIILYLLLFFIKARNNDITKERKTESTK